MQVLEGVQIGDETAAALKNFSERIGVPREAVVSVMLGLAENEKRDRNGALVLARLLMACEEALKENERAAGLRAEIEVALDQFEVPTLV